jgi:hypothetical protein
LEPFLALMSEDESLLFGLVFLPLFFKRTAGIKMSGLKIATRKTLTRGMYSGGLATVIINVSELLIAVPGAKTFVTNSGKNRCFSLCALNED